MANHNVEKDENCYHCTVCKEARGDGDGFVGQECPGIPMPMNAEPVKGPFSVFVTFKNNPPTVDDMRIGGEIAKEFFNIIGSDAEGFPESVASVTIKRST